MKVLTDSPLPEILLEQVEFYRKKYGYAFCGFVMMPDHWHFTLIADETEISSILRDMKSMAARRIIDTWKNSLPGMKRLESFRTSDPGPSRYQWAFWQAGSWKVVMDQIREIERRLEYMHANPVRAGYVDREVDWKWSSARWYASSQPVGVAIDTDWARE